MDSPGAIHPINFNPKQLLNTYAVFSDLAKSFYTTWIQGLLYKIGSKGVTGHTLGWLNNLLRSRTYCIRVEDRPLKVGVPQGFPRSPLILSIMVDDFSILKDKDQTHLFADYQYMVISAKMTILYIEFHVYAERDIEAERKITPYLRKIRKWSKKWRVNFSAEKSLLVNFTRQKKKQTKPLFFLLGTRIQEVKEVNSRVNQQSKKTKESVQNTHLH
uniref:Reverse transcriptase domain-containing protein n=1 Tax=Daphnia galeata TaxID=27404 RepID=A0A8J2RD24_9CRUS|nr:unnamed protein product [Daphnia galeata]